VISVADDASHSVEASPVGLAKREVVTNVLPVGVKLSEGKKLVMWFRFGCFYMFE
jgi:hypothetical protein